MRPEDTSPAGIIIYTFPVKIVVSHKISARIGLQWYFNLMRVMSY